MIERLSKGWIAENATDTSHKSKRNIKFWKTHGGKTVF
jgi:hypothetical protein